MFSCATACHLCLLFFFLTIRRPPRSTLDRSSAASDVYKRQARLLPRPQRLQDCQRKRGRPHENQSLHHCLSPAKGDERIVAQRNEAGRFETAAGKLTGFRRFALCALGLALCVVRYALCAPHFALFSASSVGRRTEVTIAAARCVYFASSSTGVTP